MAPKKSRSDVTRRAVVQGALGLPAAPLAAKPKKAEHGAARPALIADLNRQQGALDWQLTNVQLDKPGFRSSLIEGYCSHQSIEAGDTLRIMVSANPASKSLSKNK